MKKLTNYNEYRPSVHYKVAHFFLFFFFFSHWWPFSHELTDTVMPELTLAWGSTSCFFLRCPSKLVVFPEHMPCVLLVEPSFLRNSKHFHSADLFPRGERISLSFSRVLAMTCLASFALFEGSRCACTEMATQACHVNLKIKVYLQDDDVERLFSFCIDVIWSWINPSMWIDGLLHR